MEKNVILSLSSQQKEIFEDVETCIIEIYGVDTEIAIRKQLTLKEKINIIERITNTCLSTEHKFFNPLFLEIIAKVETIDAYTNIVCESTDLYEFYDMLDINDIFSIVLPKTEYEEILKFATMCTKSLSSYKCSVMGILEALQNSKDNSEMVEQIMTLIEQIKNDTDISEFMNEVAPNLV